MKFADGFWLNQRGYEVNYANQAFEIEEIETDSSLWQHLLLYTTEL